MATVLCGTAINGPMMLRRRCIGAKDDKVTTRMKLAMDDRKVATRPVPNDSMMAPATPGVARNICSGTADTSRAPNAGNHPRAGSIVPQIPAASGSAGAVVYLHKAALLTPEQRRMLYDERAAMAAFGDFAASAKTRGDGATAPFEAARKTAVASKARCGGGDGLAAADGGCALRAFFGDLRDFANVRFAAWRSGLRAPGRLARRSSLRAPPDARRGLVVRSFRRPPRTIVLES